MKQLIIFLTCSLHLLAAAQDRNKTPYIEVYGTAEDYFMPDEIHLNITILERMKGKEKITLQWQETNLIMALQRAKLPELAMNQASSQYVNVKWKKDQNIASAKYALILQNATQVSQTMRILDSLEIQNAYLGKVTHSKIDSLNKEMRIQAIKAAKEKALYLTQAIDEKLGSPLVVQEESTYRANSYKQESLNVRGARNDASYYYGDGIKSQPATLTFEKIKLRSKMYIKFEIINP